MLIDDEGDPFAPLAENVYVNLIRHTGTNIYIKYFMRNRKTSYNI